MGAAYLLGMLVNDYVNFGFGIPFKQEAGLTKEDGNDQHHVQPHQRAQALWQPARYRHTLNPNP